MLTNGTDSEDILVTSHLGLYFLLMSYFQNILFAHVIFA